jgi:hypothetical protein
MCINPSLGRLGSLSDDGSWDSYVDYSNDRVGLCVCRICRQAISQDKLSIETPGRNFNPAITCTIVITRQQCSVSKLFLDDVGYDQIVCVTEGIISRFGKFYKISRTNRHTLSQILMFWVQRAKQMCSWRSATYHASMSLHTRASLRRVEGPQSRVCPLPPKYLKTFRFMLRRCERSETGCDRHCQLYRPGHQTARGAHRYRWHRSLGWDLNLLDCETSQQSQCRLCWIRLQMLTCELRGTRLII